MRGHNIVDGWAGAANPHPHPTPLPRYSRYLPQIHTQKPKTPLSDFSPPMDRRTNEQSLLWSCISATKKAQLTQQTKMYFDSEKVRGFCGRFFSNAIAASEARPKSVVRTKIVSVAEKEKFHGRRRRRRRSTPQSRRQVLVWRSFSVARWDDERG